MAIQLSVQDLSEHGGPINILAEKNDGSEPFPIFVATKSRHADDDVDRRRIAMKIVTGFNAS